MRPHLSYELAQRLTSTVDGFTKVDASRLSVEDQIELLLDEYESATSGARIISR